MKCQKCGKEYDEKTYYLCPCCFCEPTKKERVLDYIWKFIFSIFSLALFPLTYFGIGYLLSGAAATVLISPFFLIWGFSLVKKNEKKKKRLNTEIRKILDNPEFDYIDGLKKYEIIKKITESLDD